MTDKENLQPESMEDILSSIRQTVEEEAAAASAEIQQAEQIEAQEQAENTLHNEEYYEEHSETEDEALDLSDMLADEDIQPTYDEMATEQAEPFEEVIDIAEFNATGEETTAPAEKAENARELYKGGEIDEELMQQPQTEVQQFEEEIAEEQQLSSEEQAMADDIAEKVEESQVENDEPTPTLEAEPVTSQEQVEEEPAQTETEAEVASTTEQQQTAEETEIKEETQPLAEQVEAVTAAATAALATEMTNNKSESNKTVHLPTTPSAEGLQVTFPVEVLATALRPLVKDWVAENLPNVVERLVKEELSKLANQ